MICFQIQTNFLAVLTAYLFQANRNSSMQTCGPPLSTRQINAFKDNFPFATTRNANSTTFTLSSVPRLFLVFLLPMPKTLSEPPLPLERRERRRLNHDTQKLMVSDKENGRWVPKKMLFLPFPPPPPPLWNQSLPSHWATEEAPPPPEEEGGKRGDESPCREFSFSPRLEIKVCSSAF